MKLKTFCACLALVTYSGIAMDPTSDRGIQTAGERKATAENKSGPVGQTNLENLSKEDLLREIARLSKENTDLQQKVKKHESVLSEIVSNGVFMKQVKHNRMDIVSFLLNNGADLTRIKDAIQGAIHTASWCGDEDMTKLLAEKAEKLGIDVNRYLSRAADKKKFKEDNTNKKAYGKDISATENVEKDDSKNISAINGKSPVVRLYEYCQRKNLSLKFGYKENKEKFRCVITINGNEYNDGEYHNSKREAQNATADYTLRKLMENNGSPAPDKDNRDPTVKLRDYCLDKSTSIDVSDITYIYDAYADDTFNCKIQLKDKIFDLSLHCKSKEEAKKKIAEHVYKILTNQTKSNETSRQGLFSEENYPSSYNSREAEKNERGRADNVSSSVTFISDGSDSESSTSSDSESSGSSDSSSYISVNVYEPGGGSSPSLSPESSTSSDSESSTSSDS